MKNTCEITNCILLNKVQTPNNFKLLTNNSENGKCQIFYKDFKVIIYLLKFS